MEESYNNKRKKKKNSSKPVWVKKMSQGIPLIQLVELELLKDNPGPLTDTMRWKMRVEVLDDLVQPMTVQFNWVGSAHSCMYDQLLDEFDVGPFPRGTSEFTVECDAPNPHTIPIKELIGVTVLQIVFLYRRSPFLRVGYYAQVACLEDSFNQLIGSMGLDAIRDSQTGALRVEVLGRYLIMNQPVIGSIPVCWDGAEGE